MSENPPARHYKYNNIALLLAAMLLIVLAIGKSCRSESKDDDSSKPAVTTVVTEPSQKSEPTIAEFKAEGLDENFRYLDVRNAEALMKGDLMLLNSAFRYEGVPADLESNYKYLFNEAGVRIASAAATINTGCKRLLTAFNEMASAFYNKTGKATLMLTDIYVKDGGDDKPCYEHESGLAFDLRLFYESEGTYPEFTGTGDYAWIPQNCYKYGLIQRYPAGKEDKTGVDANARHYRYVGKPHAEIMREKNMCLEEYIEELKKYTIKEPLSFESEDGTRWAIYYFAQSTDKTTNIPIPLNSAGMEYYYTVSGNGRDGYIVSVNIPASAGTDDTII
ncbi:MAG: D-alanyl-D-alanine carboxypeptidase family protein [Ruminococcus sp.]|nr:D-alanyl-D-alanine carboxypeptidase family protein [Ruminococcus sp.]